jgi:hypothetical protein
MRFSMLLLPLGIIPYFLNSLEISLGCIRLIVTSKAKYRRLQFHEEICHLKYSLNLTQSDSHRFYKIVSTAFCSSGMLFLPLKHRH